jgi:hypothetical protein
MTPVGGIRAAMSATSGPTPRRTDSSQPAAKTETGRALIALAPAAHSDSAADHRPQAGFLAHLIATAQQLPQTRERRRAEPEQVIALYAAAGAVAPPDVGVRLRRAF